MAYTVSQLITYAYDISGIVSAEYQAVSGYQMNRGLLALNEILGDKNVENDMLPYYTTLYNFNAVIGQEQYFIANLISVSTLVLFIDNVRYSMEEVQRNLYFGTPRANNVKSLPVSFHQERVLGGTNIFLYFFPQEAYPMQLSGLFDLAPVTINQDLSLTYAPFYIAYLKFSLANRLCVEYDFAIPPQVALQLRKYEEMISQKSAAPDLSQKVISCFNTINGFNYAQANIGKGFTASGVG